jgi:hypothetical protein
VTRASAISYESADLIGGLDDEDLDEDDLDIPSLGEGYYDANVNLWLNNGSCYIKIVTVNE